MKLPAYFSALNRDFRYQLTAIGAAAPDLHVSREITGNSFAIAGGPAGAKVSWQVTGIRKDAYAKEHPIVVDTPKTSAERGALAFVPAGSKARKMDFRPTSVPAPTRTEAPEAPPAPRAPVG